MTTTMNAYDALYTNLRQQFTVIHNGQECTVGDFMRMKANKRAETALPIATTTARNTSLATVVEYINDKLTVKQAPIKDKTIRNFPFRTSLSAILSATAACALIFSCGVFALNGKTALPYTAEAEGTDYVETVTPEVDEEAVEYEVENQDN